MSVRSYQERLDPLGLRFDRTIPSSRRQVFICRDGQNRELVGKVSPPIRDLGLREIEGLQFLGRHWDTTAIGRSFPRLTHFSIEDRLVVQEMVDHDHTLLAWLTEGSLGASPLAIKTTAKVLAELGELIARLHVVSEAWPLEQAPRSLRSFLRTIFLPSGEDLAFLSGTHRRSLSYLRTRIPIDEIAAELLYQDEPRPCVIHGDLSPRNVLVKREGLSVGLANLIDWEFVSVGSPEVDVGCLFGNMFLSHVIWDREPVSAISRTTRDWIHFLRAYLNHRTPKDLRSFLEKVAKWQLLFYSHVAAASGARAKSTKTELLVSFMAERIWSTRENVVADWMRALDRVDTAEGKR